MKLCKVKLYYNTIRYLKWIQIRYQIWYRVRSELRNIFKFRYQLSTPSHSVSLKFIDWIDKPESLSGDSFRFLNLSNKFENLDIDWNFDDYGKLWNYNLNYMDFLLFSDLEKAKGINLILDFVQKLTNNSTGLAPYPVSVRGINWIKFLTKHGIQNQGIDNSLSAQYKILLDNPEYHLLGNHLLENGFSFLFGSFYFENLKLYHKAKDIIETELNEQILDDGGHFELSPMYHQIILDRLLDCINLLQNNTRFSGQESLITLMKEKSVKMLTWLNYMTFSNGNIPLLNDSATGIAPSTGQLNNYAYRLELIPEKTFSQIRFDPADYYLKGSGYRRINGASYEFILDIGKPGPDYQPGHAHADTFNFELYIDGRPVIVDTGVSTYEKNERRQYERSTSSHNTVLVDSLNSSEVWGGFRVARRARVIFLEENSNVITARHDGYVNLGLIHTRKIVFSGNGLKMTDTIDGKNQVPAIARIHLHPDVRFSRIENSISIDSMNIEFLGQDSINISDYLYAPQFNTLIPSIVIEITFRRQLNSIFHFN